MADHLTTEIRSDDMLNYREEFILYGLRKLGHPVVEVNIADEQIEECIMDTTSYFQNRHMDGVDKMYLKHKITKDFIDRVGGRKEDNGVGIVTTTGREHTIAGIGTTVVSSFEEDQNFLMMPDAVIGVEKIWKIDSRAISTNMFSVNYQLFLNEIYYFSSTEVLNYTMTKRYLEDLNFILHPDKQIRFNRRSNKLYLDTDMSSLKEDDYLIIECYRALDPSSVGNRVYGDLFFRRYFTALMKRQWGQNLMKFQGVKMPGGMELNGRQIWEDGTAELEKLESRMNMDYELPPLDFIG
tara:strand:+ start:255 stop:1142 length:888 start_codon:yes stop_codon:yes gene_type:complete